MSYQEGGLVRIVCGECDRETVHSILKLKQQTLHTDDFHIWDDFMIVQCRGCETTSFLHESTCSEDEDWDPELEQMVPVPTVKIYPSRIAGRKAFDGLYELPHGLVRVYKETHAAICNQLNILAGIGIRSLIESVCKHQSIHGGTLKAKIDQLESQLLVTPTGAKILHSIRDLGNDAAHDARPSSSAQLGIAFDVVEHLLREVYILPKRSSQLSNPAP